MATATKTHVEHITDPQRGYLKTLLGQPRDIGIELRNEITLALAATGDERPSKLQASYWITTLKVAPWKKHEGAVEEPGYYEHEGIVYHVVKAKAGHLYAKHLTLAGWEFAKGAMARLSAGEKIDVERAMEISKVQGRCIRCLKTLTADKSVKAGIGPVCVKYFM